MCGGGRKREKHYGNQHLFSQLQQDYNNEEEMPNENGKLKNPIPRRHFLHIGDHLDERKWYKSTKIEVNKTNTPLMKCILQKHINRTVVFTPCARSCGIVGVSFSFIHTDVIYLPPKTND